MLEGGIVERVNDDLESIRVNNMGPHGERVMESGRRRTRRRPCGRPRGSSGIRSSMIGELSGNGCGSGQVGMETSVAGHRIGNKRLHVSRLFEEGGRGQLATPPCNDVRDVRRSL